MQCKKKLREKCKKSDFFIFLSYHGLLRNIIIWYIYLIIRIFEFVCHHRQCCVRNLLLLWRIKKYWIILPQERRIYSLLSFECGTQYQPYCSIFMQMIPIYSFCYYLRCILVYRFFFLVYHAYRLNLIIFCDKKKVYDLAKK